MTFTEQPLSDASARFSMPEEQRVERGGASTRGQTDLTGRRTNVGSGERTVSLAAGAILILNGLGRRDLLGLVIAGVGGAMIHRGATGYCHMYQALGLDTAHEPGSREDFEKRSAHVQESFLIHKSREELYSFWRNFENLPRIMTHLESVKVVDGSRSHWVANAPAIAGGKVEWDAEIIADEPNTRIQWRSLEGADVDNRGSVEFSDAPGDRGTLVRVTLDYLPPAGTIGRLVAKLFGEDPERQVKDDLRNFKRLMETGEIVTTAGQPKGTCTGQGVYSDD